ncbi:MAG: hypothetical protein ACYC63_04870 [Armatimonadota bacterium]
MADSRLELMEQAAWLRTKREAEQRARGSRAGTVTAAGASMTGLVLAESSMDYMATYTISGGVVTVQMALGTGLGTTGGTFATGE